MRVKCLAQEHNMSPARPRTRTTRSGVERTNPEATAPPTMLGDTSCITMHCTIRVEIKFTIVLLIRSCCFFSQTIYQGKSGRGSQISAKLDRSHPVCGQKLVKVVIL